MESVADSLHTKASVDSLALSVQTNRSGVSLPAESEDPDNDMQIDEHSDDASSMQQTGPSFRGRFFGKFKDVIESQIGLGGVKVSANVMTMMKIYIDDNRKKQEVLEAKCRRLLQESEDIGKDIDQIEQEIKGFQIVR